LARIFRGRFCKFFENEFVDSRNATPLYVVIAAAVVVGAALQGGTGALWWWYPQRLYRIGQSSVVLGETTYAMYPAAASSPVVWKFFYMPMPSFCVLCRGNGYVACSRCFLPVCRKCHKHIGDVKICLKCFNADSTFQRSRGGKGMLEKTSAIVLGAVLGFVLIARFFPYQAGQQSATQAAFSSVEVSHQRIEREFSLMSPAEHLEAAKSMLDGRNFPHNLEMLMNHLASIPEEAPESSQVPTLTERLDERLEQIEAEEEARREAEVDSEPLEIVKSSWQRGEKNPVAVWEITFKNRSKRPVGNMKFRTEYFSETGRTISRGGLDRSLRQIVIQKVIAPLSSRTITINDGFVRNDASDASFVLVGWQFVGK
jgi:uncharacterized membrane-anchored protein YhcB (DUF1043 family)